MTNFSHTQLLASLFLVLPLCAAAQVDPLIGTWKAVDKDGATSVIEVYLEKESLSAKIVLLNDEKGKEINPLCSSCDKELKDVTIVGMRFIWGLRKQGARWIGGNVVNLRPGFMQGVIASCELELVGSKAKIFGRWGPFFGSDSWDSYVADK